MRCTHGITPVRLAAEGEFGHSPKVMIGVPPARPRGEMWAPYPENMHIWVI
jgi:hypothetical protein